MTERQVQAELGDGLDLRAELVAVMKRGYSMHGDGLVANLAAAALAAGWRPAEQAAAERAERIAAAIEGSTQLAGDPSTAWSPYADGRLAQAREDARIARETR
jgi:hypothetical protein